MNEKLRNKIDFVMYHASKLKMLVHDNPTITDHQLSQRLGISFSQLQDVKRFCKMNKMTVNKPPKNKFKKDVRGLKNV